MIISANVLYFRPSLWQQFTDFANVLKAFIGTSYLSLPFAFYQSGIVVSNIKNMYNYLCFMMLTECVG